MASNPSLSSLVDPRLDQALDATWSRLAERFEAVPEGDRLWPTVAGFLERSGKCIRPRLMLGAWEAWSGRSPPDPLFPAAAALEAFHAFLLIHDDVIDGSYQRRKGPALHRAIQGALGFTAARAEHLAIVVGDVLFGFAGERLLALADSLPADRVNTAVRHFLSVSADTGLGEAAELMLQEAALDTVSADAIETVYVLKTARYTFESPIRIGLLLADADDEAISGPLATFGRLTGLAFQAENDLHEFRLEGTAAEALGYDLQCGVKTLVLKETECALPADRKTLFLDHLAALANGAGERDLQAVQGFVRESGAMQRLEDRIHHWLEDGAATLLTLGDSPARQNGLSALARLIRGKLHHSEASTSEADS
ncbi:MAG: polyprenyl synthetase family protein [Opitutales bacterium]